MDVVGIRDHLAAITKERLEAAEERVEAKCEELGTQRAALSDTTAGGDTGGGGTIQSEEEVGGGGVHGANPREEGRKASGDHLEELPTVQRVKRVADVEGRIDPVWVMLEEAGDGVCEEG